MAETRTDAEAAFDGFIESYGVKYEKAVECLSKDRGSLLAFYDFPAEHWKHLRTTNPIESTIATRFRRPELGVLMELEVSHGETEVYTGIQA
jgi:transposase-like protein